MTFYWRAQTRPQRYKYSTIPYSSSTAIKVFDLPQYHWPPTVSHNSTEELLHATYDQQQLFNTQKDLNDMTKAADEFKTVKHRQFFAAEFHSG